MADPAIATNLIDRRMANKNTMSLAGRVESVRRMNSGAGYSHAVMIPAVDEFSHPAMVEIRHEDKLGEKGDDLVVEVHPGGIMRRFAYTDRETGEKKTGVEFRTWFNVAS